jgi:hypothetical protein
VYSKYSTPCVHLALEKIIVHFGGTMIFKHYMPKEYICFEIKICKFCHMSSYSFVMDIILREGQDTCDHRLDSNIHNCKASKRKVEGSGE